MWVSDSTSSQAVERQRRHAADEKQRVDRVATDTAVREDGAVRQAGAAPTREDVQRFRMLMQTRVTAPQTPTRTPTPSGAPASSANSSTANNETPSTPPTMADRFRALFQRTADAQSPSRSSTQSGHAADDSSAAASTHSSSAKPEGVADGKHGTAADPGSRPTEPSTAVADVDSDAAKPASTAASKLADGDGRRAQDARTSVAQSKHDDGAADSAQHAQQVARGEVQTPPVVRKAHDDDATEDGGGAQSRPTNALAPPGMTSSDMAAPLQRMPDAPQQMAATAGLVAPALAELIQKHVKQMLVSETRGGGARSRELLLRMQSDVLPGTDLWLTRTESGWRMRADVRSRDAYDTLLANQDDLIQRFADGALGELSIEPVFHG